MTTIAVEGTFFAFGFSKKYDLSLLSIKGRVLDRGDLFLQMPIISYQMEGGGMAVFYSYEKS